MKQLRAGKDFARRARSSDRSRFKLPCNAAAHNGHTFQMVTILCCFGASLFLGPDSALAQVAKKSDARKPSVRKPASQQPRNSNLKPTVETPAAFLKQLAEVNRELVRLGKKQKGQAPNAKEDRRIHVLLKTPHLGTVYDRTPNRVRFLAARLVFLNLTEKPVAFALRTTISLLADKKKHTFGELSRRLRYQGFPVGGRNVRLGDLKPPDQLKLPAGGTGSVWAYFTGIRSGGQIPELVLQIDLGAQKTDLNVNDHALAMLRLRTERIGPRDCLGLLTIDGAINTVNVGSLVDSLDQLATQKVGRVVIRWTKSAARIDSQTNNWLQQASALAGQSQVTNNANNRYPVIPVTIRELHLAQIPSRGRSQSSYSRYSSRGLPRVHKTDRSAIRAALASAYAILPREELLEEIERGHPLTREAALSSGGGRLTAEQLPVVLRYADGNDPPMQRAALQALQHFGEKQAIDKLVHYTRQNSEPLTAAAAQSLAASRFAAAHRALLDVLKTADADAKKKIVKVLARYPRPLWAEAIYEFANDPGSGIGIEALQALARIGHPKLVPLLRKSLERGNPALKTETFKLLVARTDRESEQLAMNYTLNHLEQSPPTPSMTSLLNRTKDPRAVALLLAHLKKTESNRTALINTLATIGDQSVAEQLVKIYPTLKKHEKSSALQAVQKLRSPAYRTLAAEALLSKDSTLIRTATRGLQQDGGPEAVRLLIQAFETSKNTSTWSYTANALATLGTPAAQTALRKARESSNAKKRTYAVNALRSLRQRSPGYQFVSLAQRYSRERKWKESLAQFALALKVNPLLSDAYSGRGNVFLKQNKNAAAKKDFTKALKLDPYDSQAVTGMGIVLVVEGKSDEGIKLVEDSRKKFANDRFFAYNTACVYSRAFEQLQKNDTAADRDKKSAAYRNKAIAELKRAVKMGFRQYDWMKKDPDLKPLHDLPQFKQIIAPGEKKQRGAAEKADAVPVKAKATVPAAR